MLQLVTCFCFFAILVLVSIRTWFLELERSHLNPDEISLTHYNLMAPTFWLLDPALRKMVFFVFSLLSFPLKFCFSISVDLFLVLSLCCGLLLASKQYGWVFLLLPDLQQELGLQVGVFHWPLPTVGLFFVFFLSFLFWIFVWLLEEVFTLLWVFLHHENGDFSILMKDIQGRWGTNLESTMQIGLKRRSLWAERERVFE